MTQAVLDQVNKIRSAVDHGRPKDARRLLDELENRLGEGAPAQPVASAHAANGAARTPAPGAATKATARVRGHRVYVRVPLDSGISFECLIPPRPGDKFDMYLSESNILHTINLARAVERCEQRFAQLCEKFKEWDLGRV